MADLCGIRETRAPDWQPIETAPKDGSTFLAYTAEEGIDFFHWQGLSGDVPVGWRDSFINVYREGDARGPSHWMPLPLPPQNDLPELADATPNSTSPNTDRASS
jgi:hypothetical protein